jgi:hypothetical protein
LTRSAREIEAEIRRTRDRIGAALDALAGRLAPRRLVERGLAAAKQRRQPGETAGLHAEPLAFGLIAVGLAWIVVGNIGRQRQPAVEESPCAQRGPEDRAEPDDPKATHPLLIGLLGLGAGVALGALLPSSRGERQLIDRAREELWQGAEALGHETAARLRDLCEAATAAAAAEEPSAQQTETGKRHG